MTNEEANKVLEEMNVYPEELTGESKRLFEAIMKIVDSRDKAEADLYEANNRINDLLDIVKQKDKEIECWKEQAEGYSGLAKQIEQDYREQGEINNG